MTNPYTTGGRTAPKWARKRYVLSALFLAFCMGIAASGEGNSSSALATGAVRVAG